MHMRISTTKVCVMLEKKHSRVTHLNKHFDKTFIQTFANFLNNSYNLILKNTLMSYFMSIL